MKHQTLIYLSILFLPLCFFGQSERVKKEFNEQEWLALTTNEEYHKEWLEETLKPGITMNGDTLSFSLEARRLMGDSLYRSKVYKKTYSFKDVQQSLVVMQLQKAFWQMIHLYPNHKNEVIQYTMMYKDVIDVNKVVLGAFYTYAFFDPEITKIENNKPVITRPDLFEEKFRIAKEIISYASYFDEKRNKVEKGTVKQIIEN